MGYYSFWIISGLASFIAVNCKEILDENPNIRANKPIWNETYADALKRDLLMSYDKFSRPTQHFNVTKVKLDLDIKHIDFDEASSVFTLFGWFRMQWNDEKLKWDEKNYGNLSKIGLAQHEIWQPDIQLYNSITHNVDYYGATNFLVYSSGDVHWVPPSTFKTFCDSNLRYWPFDSHKCALIFGSWIYSGHEIDLRAASNPEWSPMIGNSEWDVTDVAVGRSVTHYTCCVEPYIDIRYNVTIVRRSTIYQTVIFAPSFIIILLTLMTFWLPAQYSEKILLNGITALMIVLFLLYFSQKLKIMASHTPLIVLFYSHSLYMVCFSTLVSVVVINLTRTKHQRALPWIIKKHLDGKFGKFLLLDHINDNETDNQPRTSELREHPFDEHLANEEQQIIQQCRNGKCSLKTDYLKLATAIDRIAFTLYLFLFTIFGFAYSI